MSIQISTESTVDLTKELLKEYSIKTIPFTVIIDGKEGADGVITPKDIFDYYKTTGKLASTGAVNEYQYTEFFKELLKDHDQVIHIAFSSDMSTACNSAIKAAEQFEGKVKIIDSKTLSSAIGLLCIYASRLNAQNVPFDEIVKKVSKRVDNAQASFVLEKVNFLYKGGRCSTLAYIGANILGIKPMIVVKGGKCVSGAKTRGKFDMVVKKYVSHTLEQFPNPDLEMVFITYTTCDQHIVDEVRKTLQVRGFKNIYATNAGSTVSCHCGEHCLGILYFTDGPHPEDYKDR